MKYLSAAAFVLSAQLSSVVAEFPGPDYHSLPTKPVFPGPWEKYIQAPKDKSFITPTAVWKTEGNVTNADVIVDDIDADEKPKKKKKKSKYMTITEGSLVTFEFDQNIAGRVCFEVEGIQNEPFVALSYSESPFFADRETDATGDRDRDLNLLWPLERNGTNCVGVGYIRGGFKYLTIHIPRHGNTENGFWHGDSGPPLQPPRGTIQNFWEQTQKFLGSVVQNVLRKKKKMGIPVVKISSIWVICTSFPSNPNPRAYTGYFDSSSTLLNRIWYAGVYTLQLSTIIPQEGSAIINVNRRWDGNNSPYGSWYSNFSIANGSAVTTDGAKRDRMVWPGDMFIATPGIAVSTYDMVSIRNALNTLFDHQYSNGELPWAGPPLGLGHEFSDTYHLHTLLGVYIYVLYSGDLNYLEEIWDKYLFALSTELAKVDETGLLHVTSSADWLRPGMTGHNMEASAIMHEVLLKSIQLAHFIGDDRFEADPINGLWARTARGIETASERMWCPGPGFFGDNIGRRNCGGSEQTFAQDANSWALLTGVLPEEDPRPYNISMNLRSRWGKYGAPAVEFPNTISPFATSFELLGHCRAGNYDAAVELMLLQWGYMLDGPGMTNSTYCEGYRTDGYIHYPAYPPASRNSHSHGWSSGPTMTLITEILGIHLDSPLGRTWHITPHITSWLSHARGGFATKMGKFEVKMKRVVDKEGRKAQLLDVRTPVNTRGKIEWQGELFESNENGRAIFVALEYASGLRVLELDNLVDEDDFEGDEESWASKTIYASEEIGELKFDHEWKEPVMIEREAGVVDFDALEANYWKAPWKPVGRPEL